MFFSIFLKVFGDREGEREEKDRKMSRGMK